MAQADPAVMTIRVGDYTTSKEIDWPRMFPNVVFGPHRDPRALARQIVKDVDKLKSCSPAGRHAIIEERCAHAGVSPDGVPTFYIGRTKAV